MEDGGNELDLLQEKITEVGMSEEAREKAEAELKKTANDVANVCGGNGCSRLY